MIKILCNYREKIKNVRIFILFIFAMMCFFFFLGFNNPIFANEELNTSDIFSWSEVQTPELNTIMKYELKPSVKYVDVSSGDILEEKDKQPDVVYKAIVYNEKVPHYYSFEFKNREDKIYSINEGTISDYDFTMNFNQDDTATIIKYYKINLFSDKISDKNSYISKEVIKPELIGVGLIGNVQNNVANSNNISEFDDIIKNFIGNSVTTTTGKLYGAGLIGNCLLNNSSSNNEESIKSIVGSFISNSVTVNGNLQGGGLVGVYFYNDHISYNDPISKGNSISIGLIKGDFLINNIIILSSGTENRGAGIIGIL